MLLQQRPLVGTGEETRSISSRLPAFYTVIQTYFQCSSLLFTGVRSNGSDQRISGTATLLYGPMGLTPDPMGNLYVADRRNHRIRSFQAGQTTGGTVVGTADQKQNDSTTLNPPYSVILDKQNASYSRFR